MSKSLKEVNTLFHSTTSFSAFKSIIKNGFYPSYAEEYFAGRKQLILMVSFSNIPLIESQNQLDYGRYIVGVNREWGIKNKLHPVIYTYDQSEFGREITDTSEASALGQALSNVVDARDKGFGIHINKPNLKKMGDLVALDLKVDQAKKLEEIFEDFFRAAYLTTIYTKNYSVKKKSKTIIAFNDREWRYIPKENLGDKRVLVFETDAENKVNQQYTHWKNTKKPHGKAIPLKLEITDIKYLIVKKEAQILPLYNFLEKHFQKEVIYDLIKSGSLKIYSMDNLKHNF